MKFIKDIITKKRQSPDEHEVVNMDDRIEPAVSEDNAGEDLLESLASIQSKIQGALNSPERKQKKAEIEEPGTGVIDNFADVIAEIAKPEKVDDKPNLSDVAISESAEEIETKEIPHNPEVDFNSIIGEAEPVAVTKAKPAVPKPEIPKSKEVSAKDDAPSSEVRKPAPVEKPLETRSNRETERQKLAEIPTPNPRIVEVPAPSAGRTGRRAGRVKTRLLGFEQAQDASTDPFDSCKKVTDQAQVSFPVGWIVVVDGPGRGASFSLFNGVSQIGRGEDQAIKLDFGDNSISRNNHAAIAYDNEQRSFFLGHGGKANLVRLNDKPVLSTEEISNSDLIRIGETSLRFVALCDSDFDWELDSQEEIDDAAIA